MMNGNLPSAKRLEEVFHGKGRELRSILERKVKPDSYKPVADWVRQCHHTPSKHDQVMMALNCVLEGHGVEAVFRVGDDQRPDMEYINMGDTYDATIIFDHTTGTYKVQSYGDWVEISERKGRRYE